MGRKNKYNWKEIQEYYDLGHTWRELTIKFGCARNALNRAVLREDLIPRTGPETIRIKSIISWVEKDPANNQQFYQDLIDGKLKLCTLCKEVKALAKYNKNSGRSDGLQSHCRECGKAKSKNYYHSNQKKHSKVVRQRNVKLIKENQQKFYEYLGTRSCIKCGESNPLTFDMDHLKNKKANVSTLLNTGNSWATIQKEIDKCQLLCANCHRIKTHTEQNTAKYRYFVLGESVAD